MPVRLPHFFHSSHGAPQSHLGGNAFRSKVSGELWRQAFLRSAFRNVQALAVVTHRFHDHVHVRMRLVGVEH